ncbi:unnamed protein product [Symbiodinium necroappetens]|uniref:Uncharacterized protein n=1 Tax=Symbiodinium necroappetens TaxID=1628268 RepID=A0A813A2Q3_9DINO|nr:unnamed protein product [Symbiodinium necroappetens]
MLVDSWYWLLAGASYVRCTRDGIETWRCPSLRTMQIHVAPCVCATTDNLMAQHADELRLIHRQYAPEAQHEAGAALAVWKRCDDIKFLTGLGLDKSFVLQLVGQVSARSRAGAAEGKAVPGYTGYVHGKRPEPDVMGMPFRTANEHADKVRIKARAQAQEADPTEAAKFDAFEVHDDGFQANSGSKQQGVQCREFSEKLGDSSDENFQEFAVSSSKAGAQRAEASLPEGTPGGVPPNC